MSIGVGCRVSGVEAGSLSDRQTDGEPQFTTVTLIFIKEFETNGLKNRGTVDPTIRRFQLGHSTLL